jgi:hypothetical protein
LSDDCSNPIDVDGPKGAHGFYTVVLCTPIPKVIATFSLKKDAERLAKLLEECKKIVCKKG